MMHVFARRAAILGLLLAGLAPRPATAQQLGGRRVFPFLDLPPSAGLAALGGMSTSARTDDPSMLYGNPALLNADMDGRLALSYVGYVADIKQSTAAYVFNTQKLGRVGVGITYLNYGSFESYDAAGNSLGTFGVNEYTAGLTDAYTKGNFTVGATAKLAVSSIAGSRSLAGVADAGIVYKHPTADFTAGLVVKNLGYQFVPYPGTDRGSLPLDVQLGAPSSPSTCPSASRSRPTTSSSGRFSTSTPVPAVPSMPAASRRCPPAASATTWPGISRPAPPSCWARACSYAWATTTCSAANCASTIPAAAPASRSEP